MFEKIIKVLVCICFSCILFIPQQIKAAIFGVSASNNGDGTTTITISGPCAGGFVVSAGGASANVGKSTLDSNASVTLNTGAGTFTVTAASISVTDASYNLIDEEASTTVTVTLPSSNSGGGTSSGNGTSGGGGSTSGGNSTNQTPTPTTIDDKKSSDNALSSLVVSKGTLDPIFESGTTEYKITLSADVTTIVIDATANDAKASVSGTGEQSVKPGDNKLEIVVTAENGTTKSYVINVYVDEKPTSFIKMNGKDFGVVPNIDDVSSPTGFEKTTLMIDGKEIPVWKNSMTNVTLVYLLNEKSEKNFYILENNQAISIYKPIALLGYNLAIIDIPSELQTRKGFLFTEVEIDGQKLQGWAFENDNFHNFSLIYVMNEKGEKVYYQYEKTSNTLQPYSGAAAITQEVYEKQCSTIFMLWIATGILGTTTLLFVTMWLLQIRKNKRIKYDQSDVIEEPEESVTTEENEEQQEELHEQVPVGKHSVFKKEPHVNEHLHYHRQTIPEEREPRNKEADSGTQPFRFHDDFDEM